MRCKPRTCLAAAATVVDMVTELSVILSVCLARHKQTEVNHKKKLDLKRVDLMARHPADLRVVRVVEVLVIEELGRKHEAA